MMCLQRGGGGHKDVRSARRRRRQAEKTSKLPRSDRREHRRPRRWVVQEHGYWTDSVRR